MNSAMKNTNITIVRSKRKSVAIQVGTDLSVTVRAPWFVTNEEINRILEKKEDWILNSIEKMRENNKLRENRHLQPRPMDEIRALADDACKVIPKRVAYYAPIVGVSYGRITIRNQQTRWGSCSGKGNLNFNCLLMLAPPEVLDYVVVHELCHRKEMNHSQAFWAEVERVLPNYREAKQWLKTEGNKLMWID